LSESFDIGRAFRREYDAAMELAWVVFLEHTAPHYPAEGVKSFREFLSDPILHRMFIIGEYELLLARNKTGIVGMASIRDNNVLSLLFVDSKYQKSGIGKALVEAVTEEIKSLHKSKEILVNSSPNATSFYKKIGFKQTGNTRWDDGISFIPMAKEID